VTHPELLAMRKIADMLDALDSDRARLRVLDWVNSRYYEVPDPALRQAGQLDAPAGRPGAWQAPPGT
jgi:hypothetical protein